MEKKEKGSEDCKSPIEKRRDFIINVIYAVIIALIVVAVLKFGLPMLSPFVAAFAVAWILKKPIRFLSEKLHINRKLVAILLVLLFYSTIGLLLTLGSIKAYSAMETLVLNLPVIYAQYAEPVLTQTFNGIERSVKAMDPSLMSALASMFDQFIQSIGQMVSSLSVGAMGVISGAATSLPGLFIKMLLAVISSFFIAIDYDQLVGFCMRQLSTKTNKVVLQIKKYVIGTLFVCIRSYALIMFITFVELSIGLSLIGIKGSVMIALVISVFDVLPVLGTGGIMIPWTVITALQGNYPLALGLLVIYLVITVIRNIIEPKIVGSQIGLHPVVTLISLFAGAQLFGVIGLFGFPITLSLLRHLNDTGTIRLLKKEEPVEESE